MEGFDMMISVKNDRSRNLPKNPCQCTVFIASRPGRGRNHRVFWHLGAIPPARPECIFYDSNIILIASSALPERVFCHFYDKNPVAQCPRTSRKRANKGTKHAPRNKNMREIDGKPLYIKRRQLFIQEHLTRRKHCTVRTPPKAANQSGLRHAMAASSYATA
jgi:hypothetical protein